MARYSVTVLPYAERALDKIRGHQYERLRSAIVALADDPRPAASKPLVGREAWRLRVGDYRIIYEIQDAVLVVTVVEVGHRKEIYR